MTNPFSLEGKTILVTGASSGIGRGIAIACAGMGAKVIVTARNEARLKETLAQCEGEGHSYICANLSTQEGVLELVEQIEEKIDGVVCAAGVVETQVLKLTDEADMERIFSTNTFSTIRIVRELLQQKKTNKGASIVLISSISGVRCGYIGGSIYGASKGALEGFVKATALELAPQHIRVNSITPGMVETHLLDNSAIDKEQIEADKQRYPLKRYGRPDEIGYAAVYMLSNATEWMTGTSLLIDGGYTLN